MVALIFVVCVIVGVLVSISFDNTNKNEVQHISYVRQVSLPKPKKQTATKKQIDPLFKEAKEMLVMMGYSATEAKGLLQGVSGNDVQDYVRKAMGKVKV